MFQHTSSEVTVIVALTTKNYKFNFKKIKRGPGEVLEPGLIGNTCDWPDPSMKFAIGTKKIPETRIGNNVLRNNLEITLLTLNKYCCN